MATAFGVGVREFVNENDLRSTGDDGVKVHFLEPLAFVFDPSPWNDFQALQQRFGFSATVGFDDTDNDIVPVFLAGMGLLQHLVGLTDAWSRAHEDPELADTAFFAVCRCEQGFRRRPMFGITPLIRHHLSDVSTFRRSAALAGGQAVEREIEQQNIDARLAQQPKKSILDVIADELSYLIFRQVARLGNTWNLEVGGFRRDIRIEPAGRSRDQVDRHRERRDSPS